MINGAERLYQLFKNIVLMSLIRQKQRSADDTGTQKLFEHLALSSIRGAQRIALYIFGYHKTKIENIRDTILNTMEYVQKGGIDSVTAPTMEHRLDGLFIQRFDNTRKETHEINMDQLYKDKSLIVEIAIAFIVIFLSFLNNPNYYVRGISEGGIRPEFI